MAKIFEFLAEGFEEIEALAPVDIERHWCFVGNIREFDS